MTGGCLCGAVRFQADGPLRGVITCHCTQCRKWSGHVWAATSVALDRFRLTAEQGLVWYRSSPVARRGFCGTCGASLFWQKDGEDRISVAPGALDGPTGLIEEVHIFCADKGDYYPLPADVPTLPQW